MSSKVFYFTKGAYEDNTNNSDEDNSNEDNTNKSNSINFKAKQIASKLKIDDRVQKLDENEAYVTIKDHKERFPEKISCRLINPCKTDIGKISKQILDRVNNTTLKKT